MMRRSHVFVLALVAALATACVADPESSDSPTQAEPEANPEPMPEANPEPMPEANPEPMPEPAPEANPEPMPEPAPDEWMERCFNIDPAIAADALALTGASATLQDVGDSDAPYIQGGDFDGRVVAAFTANFEGGHYFQAIDSDLIVLQSDCTATPGVDPGNDAPELTVHMAPGETVFVLTRRMSRAPQGVRVEQPRLRPQPIPESWQEGFHFVRVFGHQTGRCTVEARFDAQWDSAPSGAMLHIYEGDTRIYSVGRSWSDAETSWWADSLPVEDGRPAASYRFVLEARGTVDEVEVLLQPAAMVQPGEECDPEEISSVCTGGLACVGRFCEAVE